MNEFVKYFGQWGYLQNMVNYVDKELLDEMEQRLEISAVKLRDDMKVKIKNDELGLAPNTEMTKKLKGGDIPLVDSGQMVNAIVHKKVSPGEMKLVSKGEEVSNKNTSYFVGVWRASSPVSVGSKHLGEPQQKSVVNIAKLMCEGFTAVLPRSGIEKHVPKRDFATPCYREHLEWHKNYMKGAITKEFKAMIP